MSKTLFYRRRRMSRVRIGGSGGIVTETIAQTPYFDLLWIFLYNVLITSVLRHKSFI